MTGCCFLITGFHLLDILIPYIQVHLCMSKGEAFPNLYGQLDVTGLNFQVSDAPSCFSVCLPLIYTRISCAILFCHLKLLLWYIFYPSLYMHCILYCSTKVCFIFKDALEKNKERANIFQRAHSMKERKGVKTLVGPQVLLFITQHFNKAYFNTLAQNGAHKLYVPSLKQVSSI